MEGNSGEGSGGAAPWLAQQAELADLARRQLFFVGGAPRSGTTWLQQMLDHHPDISCRGEALFQQDLAKPLDRLMAARRAALAAKNAGTFRHMEGYPLPPEADADILLATAILLAFRRQAAGAPCRAIGEKTPENTFLFPRLKRLFPAAKFIGIARDPRDSLTSAWHFWAKAKHGHGGGAAVTAFVRAALPAVEEGMRRFLAYCETYEQDCRIVTYEALLQAPEQTLAGLFRFLGVADAGALVADSIANTRFIRLTGGRPPGEALDGAFLRKGVAGDWASTLPRDAADLIASRLGWAFARFGWR